MQAFEYAVPEEVTSNSSGYEFLAYICATSFLSINNDIIFNFTKCKFFEGNLCAVLGNIIESLKDRNNRIHFQELKGNLRGAFSRNGFLGRYSTAVEIPKTFATNVPYARFKMSDEVIANRFFRKELFGKENMIRMSDLVQKEIIRNIFEICLNAHTHGGCEHVYCCGQFNLRKVPKLTLTLADLGKTIKANVNNHLHQNFSGPEAIKWALTEGNTTKTSAIPGGLGLKLVQSLIKLNKGKLQILSSNGLVEIHDGIVTEDLLALDFPGTIVTIELLLTDPNFYILQSEENDWNNIF